MTDHHGAVDAFEWADPARRWREPVPAIDSETYLAGLLAADVDVDVDRSRPGPSEPSRRHRRLPLLAAAAAVVAIGWLFTGLDDGRATRIATDPALAPGEAPPTGERLGIPKHRSPAVAPPVDQGEAADAAWDAVTPWVIGDGSRGRYRSMNFQPDVQFLVTDGWTRPAGASEVPDGLAPLVRLDRPTTEGLLLARHKHDATVEDWLARMREHPSTTVEAVEPAMLGEAVGVEVRFQVSGPMTYVNLTAQDSRVLAAGQAGVAIVADVDGAIVSALMLAETADDLPAIEGAAEPIIDSIHWRALCDGP